MEACVASGIDGFIIVDLPPEEGEEFIGLCDEFDLSFVPLHAQHARVVHAAHQISHVAFLLDLVRVLRLASGRDGCAPDAGDGAAAQPRGLPRPVCVSGDSLGTRGGGGRDGGPRAVAPRREAWGRVRPLRLSAAKWY